MKSILLLLLISSGHFRDADDANCTGCNPQSANSSRLFQFESFVPGRVHFRNGTFTNAILNYNYLHGAVQFLNGHGDTLLLTNKDRIEYITIGESIFYSQQPEGEVQFIGDYGQVSLTQKTHLLQKGSKSSSSEQKFQSSSDATTPSTLLISNQSGEFQWQNNSLRPDYGLKTHYYLIDRNRRFHHADKAGFLRIFAKEKAALLKHLRKKPVNFNDQIQIKELLVFCSEL